MFRLLFLLFICIPGLYAQLIVTTAVGGAVRSGVSAENIQLNGTHGITHDPSGNLVFCERYVIHRINPDGALQTIAGTGISGFSGDGGPATQAQLNYPVSPQYDSKGNLYFIDNGTRIRRVDPKGVITTFAGTGIPGTLGASGPLVDAQIFDASSIAIASDDSIYIAEFTDIRRITNAGTIELVAGGANSQCVIGDGGDTATNTRICGPHSLALDSKGSLYFVEDNYGNNPGMMESFVYAISPAGAVTQFAGFGSPAAGLGDGGPAMRAIFNGISALAFDALGNMYVADSEEVLGSPAFSSTITSASLIRRIAASDGIVTTIAGELTAPSPLEGPALQAYLSLLSGLAPKSDGSISFSSTNTIGELTAQSAIQLLAGRSVQLPPDGVQAAGAAWLSLPVSVQMAPSRSGNFFFTDHCMIRRVGTNGILSTVAGTGNCASSVPASYGPSIDLPPITALAADSHDKIFAIFTSGVYALALDGTISEIAGLNQFSAIAIDSEDRLYAVAFGGGGPARVDPDGSVEFLNWIQQRIPAGVEWLTSPTITVDGSDNVYLLNMYATSGFQHLVYRFTPEGVGSSVAVLDFPDLHFAVDSLGGIWYVSFFNLEHINPSSISVRMSGPCCEYSGDGGPVVGATFDLAASASAVSSPSGDIYVLDDGNAVIRKISGAPPSKAPVISSSGIVNAASLLGGAIAPGELISIFGSNFGTAGIQTTSPVDNIVPQTLGNLRVSIGGNEGGAEAAITAATASQINVFVPYEIAGNTSVTIGVSADYADAISVTLPVAKSAFGLSTADASGSGQGAILNQDGSYNSDSNPAPVGSVVSLFGTGEGLTTPALPDGALVISTPYSIPNETVAITVGGQPADVLYAGAAPFLPTGVLQINARIPAGVTGDAPVLVSIGGISTSRKVTVAVK